MACGVEQDRLSALLPDGFTSLHSLMRINAEIRSGSGGCLEPNTPVELEGNKGWVILAFGEHSVCAVRQDRGFQAGFSRNLFHRRGHRRFPPRRKGQHRPLFSRQSGRAAQGGNH